MHFNILNISLETYGIASTVLFSGWLRITFNMSAMLEDPGETEKQEVS